MEFDPLGTDSSETQEQLVSGYLTALVQAWEPEHLSVCLHSFHKAQGCKTPQVRIGWRTYIRSSVAIDLDLLREQIQIAEGDGGHYLTLSGTPYDPSLEQAMLIRRALGY